MADIKTFFGRLERAIMNVVWGRGPSTVRQVVDELPAQHRVAYTTAMTVMNRLVQQGYLRRRPGRDGAFVYQATLTKAGFSTAATRQNIDQLVRQYGDVALIQFLETVDRIPSDKLQRLRQQLRKKRSR